MPHDASAAPAASGCLPRNYTRWAAHESGALFADLIGTREQIGADPARGLAYLNGNALTPDHARLIGVRLIEAAALADGPRAVRSTPGEQQ